MENVLYKADVLTRRAMVTLPASTVTMNASPQLQTSFVTVTGERSCPSFDPVTVYKTVSASTIVITETPAPEIVTRIQQETVYITAGRSYSSSRTWQPSTIIQTVTVTPAPLTVLQSATDFFTVDGPTAYISQDCSVSPIYV